MTSDDWQDYLTGLEGDERPVTITVLQAQRIADIIRALTDGHELYEKAARNVADFLSAAALEAVGGKGCVKPTAAERWERIVNLP